MDLVELTKSQIEELVSLALNNGADPKELAAAVMGVGSGLMLAAHGPVRTVTLLRDLAAHVKAKEN